MDRNHENETDIIDWEK